MINAPRQPSQRQDLDRWENEGGALRSGHRSHDPDPIALPTAEPTLYHFDIRTQSGLIEDPEGNVCLGIQSARKSSG
jgi:hypothetical protein